MKERGPALVLIGFMGAGKTTIGQALARSMGWPLYDTDDIVATRFGMSVEEIFLSRGEETFRDAESEALATIPAGGAVIATGGGIVLRKTNIVALRELGLVTYLTADEQTLFERISRNGARRPLLRTENPRGTFRELLRLREPLYRAAADHVIDTTASNPAEVTEAIGRHVG